MSFAGAKERMRRKKRCFRKQRYNYCLTKEIERKCTHFVWEIGTFTSQYLLAWLRSHHFSSLVVSVEPISVPLDFFASDWKSCAILHLSNKSCKKFSANVISFDWFPALKSRHWLGQRNSKASVPASLTHPLNVLTHKKFSVYDPLSFLSDVHSQNGWNQHKCWQNIKCSIQLIHTHTHNCTHICKITSYHRNTPHGFWMVVLKMQDTHIYRISS